MLSAETHLIYRSPTRPRNPIAISDRRISRVRRYLKTPAFVLLQPDGFSSWTIQQQLKPGLL